MILKALLKSYEYAEKNNLVDLHNGNETVLLPIFHSSVKSTGQDIVEVALRKDGSLFSSKFLPKDEVIIFPVTEDSIARSGKYPPAHPLVDKLGYFYVGTEANKLFKAEFNQWYEFEKERNSKSYEFLNIIKKFLEVENFFMEILDKIFGANLQDIKGLEVKYKEDIKGKIQEKNINFEKIYLTFKILDWENEKNITVSENRELHKDYIEYVKSKNLEKGICNISGKEEYIINKHRGLKGNAKIISVSNNKETYKGRFENGEDIIKIGYETSEKVHLMLKYLLENKNSYKWLGENQYLINWFSNDIENKENLDLMELDNIYMNFSSDKIEEIVTVNNAKIGKIFVMGNESIDENLRYYIGIIDKASNGRISIKYFRELKISELKIKLEKWMENYNWEKYDYNTKTYEIKTPSIFDIFMGAYGIEREGKLEFDKTSFQKDQIQKLISALIDGKNISRNIEQQLVFNVKKRLSYSKKWETLEYITLSILNNKIKEKGAERFMIKRDNINRSYLYGRLLAVYEVLESATYPKGETRITNAERYWNSFVSRPATTAKILENKIQVYKKKLKSSEEKNKYLYKYENELKEIVELIQDNYMGKIENNKALDYNFIYGYYVEKKYLYTKQEGNNKNEEDELND